MALDRTRHGAVEVLVLNRPKAANSVDLELGSTLAEAFDELQGDATVRAVVITGAGERVFCAGMDLEAVRAGQADAINGLAGGFAGIVERQDFPHPVIAAVNGSAMGGGFEIVLACDMVVAAEGVLFGLPEVRHGLIAASGGLVRLARMVPPAVAFELALTGEPIGALRALELGLVNRVVGRGEALGEALEIAQRVASNAPLAVRASKQLLRFGLEGGDADIWELNSALAASVLASDDASEGTQAFSEKRGPRWSGS